MPLPTIDIKYLTTFLVDLLNIPSPTGFTEEAIAFVEQELSAYPQLELSRTRKGRRVQKLHPNCIVVRSGSDLLIRTRKTDGNQINP